MDSAAATLAPIAVVATILSALHVRLLSRYRSKDTDVHPRAEKRATRIPRTVSALLHPTYIPVVLIFLRDF